MRNRQKGNRGEAIAAGALVEAGYEIVDRNWRCALGELDLVAREGGEMVFVEVRTRTNSGVGASVDGIDAALESITPSKSARLVALAEAYLDAHDMGQTPFRIDVVAVSFNSRELAGDANGPTVEIIQNAVGW